MNLQSPRYALSLSILVCLIVYMALAACTTAPPRDITLSWVTSPNVAATCASLGMAMRGDVCVRSDGSGCLLVTGRRGVDMGGLGSAFRECVK